MSTSMPREDAKGRELLVELVEHVELLEQPLAGQAVRDREREPSGR